MNKTQNENKKKPSNNENSWKENKTIERNIETDKKRSKKNWMVSNGLIAKHQYSVGFVGECLVPASLLGI